MRLGNGGCGTAEENKPAEYFNQATCNEITNSTSVVTLIYSKLSVCLCVESPPFLHYDFKLQALTEMEHPQRNIFIYSEFDTSGIVCHFPPS